MKNQNINNNADDVFTFKSNNKKFSLTEPNFFMKKKLSKTMKNIHEKSLLKEKIKNFSNNIRNEFAKKMEKKKNLFEKQIYSPIYIQMHKSLREIEKDIKIAQQYVLPDRPILKKLKNPLIDDVIKLKPNDNKLLLNNNNNNNNKSSITNYFRTEKIKISKIRKKTGNFKNNLFIKTFSNDLNKSIYRNKDNYKIKKLVSFPPFIQEYKEKNNNKNDDEEHLLNLNIFNDTDLDSKSNLLSPTSSGSPAILKKSNTLIKGESKDINNILLKTSILSKKNTKTSINEPELRLSNEDVNKNINKPRYKTYFIEYQPEWYFKNKFIKNRFEKNMIINPMFQNKIIDDQLALLFENMKIFQSQYLIDKNLNKQFSKISCYTQKTLNCNLEEAIGLLTEISYLILNEYDNIIHNFISNPIPRITKKKFKSVINEKQEFIVNISTFSDTFVFLKVCYEAYNIIFSNKEDFYINRNNFEILNQYLDRARYVVSKICLDLKNMYKEQNNEDKKIIEDCLKKIKNVNRKALINNLKILNNNIKNNNDNNAKNKNKKNKNIQKAKIDCHQKFGLFNSGINSFRYKGPKKLKLSEEHQTNLRINRAFGSLSHREMRPGKHFSKFDINSRLVNQLMKYATNEFKSRIISERIRQRFIKEDY